jgi:hypothetical protein
MNEAVLEKLKSCIETIERGGSKTSYEDTFIKITAYKVGEIIRVDIKNKDN